MMIFVTAVIQTLLIELAGVAVFTGILYMYWNAMTRNK